MPYMTNPSPCKVCGEIDKETRYKYQYINKKFYLQSTCKDCSTTKFKEYQKENLDKFRVYNKKAYLHIHGSLVRNMQHTEETRAQWARDKANRRCTRAKQARFTDELTSFVYAEAHELRKVRDKIFAFSWHVDHIIPLINKDVCGLHIFNNFAVIPKVDNLRKGNYYSVHD